MRILSFIALGLILVLFIHPTSANHRATGHVGDNTVTYGAKDERAKLIIDNASADQFVNYAYKLFVTCNGERHKTGIGAFDENSVTNQGTTGHDTEYIFRKLVPNQIPCGIGEDYKVNMTYWDDYPGDLESWSTGTLDVESTMDNPNKGQGIAVMSDYNGGDSKIQDFFLVDKAQPHKGTRFPFQEDPPNGINSGNGQPYINNAFDSGSLIYVTQNVDGTLSDSNDNGVVTPKYGHIFGTSSGNSLGGQNMGNVNLVPWSYGNQLPGWYNGDAERLKKILRLKFDGSHRPSFDQRCSLDSNNFRPTEECAPLHSNGELKPQGEIIVASESTASISNWPTPTYRPTLQESTHFFVCRQRPGDPDWQGNQPSNSKVVKVRKTDSSGNFKDEWKYYRCDNQNSWEEIECPPGQKVDSVGHSTNLECVNKDPVTVNVKMFNITDFPQSEPGDRRVVGFKVKEQEIEKYEELMDREMKKIDAQCWMGDDDTTDYPPGNTNTGTFRLHYNNDGDAMVLGKVPYRGGVNDNTYSCVWGFSDRPSIAEGIFESTRAGPLKSVDNGKIDANYYALLGTYNSLKSGGDSSFQNSIDQSVDSGDLWAPYSSFDRRSYMSDIETDMFQYNDAFPYCETPITPPEVLANIECSASNKAPVADADAYKDSVNAGESVTFDASGSYDIDGSISSYNWYFDDSSSATGPTVSHSFSAAGTYDVVLKVTDNSGASKSEIVQIDVSGSPNAVADASPTQVEKGDTVDFDASGSFDDGYISSYNWDFGDGGPDTGENVQHSFSSVGDYTVELTVEDNNGRTSTDTVQVEVETAIGEADKFEVAYLPSGFSGAGEASIYKDKVDVSHSRLEAELPLYSSKVEKNVVQPDQCDVTCDMKHPSYTCNEWHELEDECIGSSNVIERTEFDVVHVICDDRSDECTGGSGLAGKVNAIGGRRGATMVFDTSDGIADTVVHEIGHNLDLWHIFNEEMLKSGWSFGDIYDPSNTDPSIGACTSIPGDYDVSVSGGQEIIELTGLPNTPDNDEGSDAINFYMSYCGPEQRYGPEALNYMQTNSLGGY